MFTEYEIESIIENDKLLPAIKSLKKEFIKSEAPYLEISDGDFLSLTMLFPTVGIALANGSVSLFEEMALNKKARKLSKGGFFLKKDPVVFGLKFVIKKYDQWEDRFMALIREVMKASFDMEALEKEYDPSQKIPLAQYRMEVLKSPYIFVRFLASFFLDEDDDIFGPRSINVTDFTRVQSIGKKLGLHKIPLFHYFCDTFEVK